MYIPGVGEFTRQVVQNGGNDEAIAVQMHKDIHWTRMHPVSSLVCSHIIFILSPPTFLFEISSLGNKSPFYGLDGPVRSRPAAFFSSLTLTLEPTEFRIRGSE